MKRTAIIIFLACAFSGVTLAQESARDRLTNQNQKKAADSSIGLSIRAAQKNRTQTSNISEAKWLREIYRYLDLEKEQNAPLYYPVVPEQDRMNLFTMIFKLLAENQIRAYEYLDGREIFTDEYKIDFKELLDRFGIYYEIQNGKVVINDVDIPSNEVQGYYLKEAYFFETGTSNYGIETLAICPIIHRQGDYEAGTVRYPLFWIPYEEIRPYTLRMPIMTSSLNNTMTGTIDDFFRKGNYEGEIYKTTNLRNLALAQQAATPEELKLKQEKIEKELKEFETNLWRERAAKKEETKATKKEDKQEEEVVSDEDNSETTKAKRTTTRKPRASTKKSKEPKEPKSSTQTTQTTKSTGNSMRNRRY